MARDFVQPDQSPMSDSIYWPEKIVVYRNFQEGLKLKSVRLNCSGIISTFKTKQRHLKMRILLIKIHFNHFHSMKLLNL